MAAPPSLRLQDLTTFHDSREVPSARTIRLTNIMTDWSKQRKHGAGRLAGLRAGFVEETFHVLGSGCQEPGATWAGGQSCPICNKYPHQRQIDTAGRPCK